MKSSIVLSIITLALVQGTPAVAQDYATRKVNTVVVPTSIKPVKTQDEPREYRLTGATLSLVSLKACKQLDSGSSMATVKANIMATIVARQEDINIRDAHRLTAVIARNAQAECGQLGSN